MVRAARQRRGGGEGGRGGTRGARGQHQRRADARRRRAGLTHSRRAAAAPRRRRRSSGVARHGRGVGCQTTPPRPRRGRATHTPRLRSMAGAAPQRRADTGRRGLCWGVLGGAPQEPPRYTRRGDSCSLEAAKAARASLLPVPRCRAFLPPSARAPWPVRSGRGASLPAPPPCDGRAGAERHAAWRNPWGPPRRTAAAAAVVRQLVGRVARHRGRGAPSVVAHRWTRGGVCQSTLGRAVPACGVGRPSTPGTRLRRGGVVCRRGPDRAAWRVRDGCHPPPSRRGSPNAPTHRG